MHPLAYWSALAAWSLASLATWTFGHRLGPLQLLAFGVLALAACVLLVWPLIAVWTLARAGSRATDAPRAKPARSLLRITETCVRLPVALAAIGLLTYFGRDLGIRLEFAACASGWERTAAHVRGGEIPPPPRWVVERPDTDRRASRANPGAPAPLSPAPDAPIAIRRAGFTDNWCGFVHDPTGELARAIERGDGLLSRSRTTGEPFHTWFGGLMIEARRVSDDPRWKDWYVCWFT